MTDSTETENLFTRVAAFKEKYSDIVNRLCASYYGLDRCGTGDKYRAAGEGINSRQVLRTFFDAVDAEHPSSPVITSELSPNTVAHPRWTVDTGTKGFLRVRGNGFVQDWLPRFRDELKEMLNASPEEKSKLSFPNEKELMDTYVLMEELIKGFKKDYLPLQRDLEAYRKVLDKQKPNPFEQRVLESRDRLEKEKFL